MRCSSQPEWVGRATARQTLSSFVHFVYERIAAVHALGLSTLWRLFDGWMDGTARSVSSVRPHGGLFFLRALGTETAHHFAINQQRSQSIEHRRRRMRQIDGSATARWQASPRTCGQTWQVTSTEYKQRCAGLINLPRLGSSPRDVVAAVTCGPPGRV